MGLLLLLLVYLVGGVTFIPLVAYIWFTSLPKRQVRHVELLRAGAIEELHDSGSETFKQGWLYVTQEYLESTDEINAQTPLVSESADSRSAYASLYKLVKNNKEEDPKAVSSTKKHRYYAVLKHGNLFLYRNERLKDVKHVVVLSNSLVTLWPRTLSEALLFTKYSAVAVMKKSWSRRRRLSDNVNDWLHGDLTLRDVLAPGSRLPPPPGTFYIYTDVNCDKEDWYFALLRASKLETEAPNALNPMLYAKLLHFRTNHMVELIQSLYSSEGQLTTKWLNAIFGRIFLALQETDAMDAYLRNRLEKKLQKMKTPGFLDKFQIKSVNAGHAAPLISYPSLKEVSPEGDIVVLLRVDYLGGMLCQLNTKANINLGLRFKLREVDVLLSMTLEKLLGPMLVKIKPQPSARLWYTFEEEPVMLVKIEPVISSRQMSYNIITNSIEKKLKEAVRTSLVFPHWDDVSLYNTEGETFRGGIWDKSEREVTVTDAKNIVNEVTGKPKAEESPKKAKQELQKKPELPKRHDEQQRKTDTDSLSLGSLASSPSGSVSGVSGSNVGGALSGSVSEVSVTGSTTSNGVLSPGVVEKVKKMGIRYNKDEGYRLPEMISNRRPRKQSSASTLSKESDKTSPTLGYDFGLEVSDNNVIARSIDKNTLPSGGPPPLPPREEEMKREPTLRRKPPPELVSSQH